MKKAPRGQRHNEEEKVKTGGSDGQRKRPNIAGEKRNGEIAHEEMMWARVRAALSQPCQPAWTNKPSGCLCLATSPSLSTTVDKNTGCTLKRARPNELFARKCHRR